MASFSKFVRPQVVDRGRISDRDLDIIEAILRYRFSPTSELIRLVGGNEDVTHRRLRMLWEWQVISRFAFPGFRSHSEFVYYLDRRQALDLLVQHGRLIEISPRMEDELEANKQADYAGAAERGQYMQLGFLKHHLMISRLHYSLEQACRKSGGRIQLTEWRQGSQIARQKVEVPKVRSSRRGGQYLWEESGETERLPVEPDALFSLTANGQPLHFLYEADRGTMNSTDMLKKLRAYFHLIKRQQKHQEAFGIHPVRAVLIETVDEARGTRLMELINHPLVCGPSKRAGLFWFTIAPLLTDPRPSSVPGRYIPGYLDFPEIVFDPIWALPDRSMHSLTDMENSAVRASA